jgi:hypothetical protein
MVHVFKTNIRRTTDRLQLAPVFNTIPGIEKWNVDLEDCDKVLRVETKTLSPASITQLVRQAGFQCEEL